RAARRLATVLAYTTLFRSRDECGGRARCGGARSRRAADRDVTQERLIAADRAREPIRRHRARTEIARIEARDARAVAADRARCRAEEHTSELPSRVKLVCR